MSRGSGRTLSDVRVLQLQGLPGLDAAELRKLQEEGGLADRSMLQTSPQP